MRKHEAVVIGVSSGGLEALKTLLPAFPADFPAPVLVVYHQGARRDRFIIDYLNGLTRIQVREAEEKEPLLPGVVYLAPPNYHLLVEEDRTLTLSTEERVSFARPSVDVLFETAAEAFGPELVGVILTGANQDGSQGLRAVKERGGTALVQNPDTAEMEVMPRAALEAVEVDRVLDLEELGSYLLGLFGG
jgi:two-component system, chemotaxis family, protein-glutamate methylesterase/glutaminase